MPVARRDLKEAGWRTAAPTNKNRISAGPGPWGEPARSGKARKLPGRGGGTWRPRGADSRPTVARVAGGKSWATQALTWAGWPRLEGGPGILVPSRIPPGRPGPPANRREVSSPPPPCRGDLSGRRGRKVACTAFSRVLPYQTQTPALGKGRSFHTAKRCDAGGDY